MAEHRVPVLDGALHRYRRSDPQYTSDPRIRELVLALATLDTAPPPRAHFRAELRTQLVAVTPRLVAEGSTETAPRAAGTTSARALTSRLPRLRLGRPIRLLVSAMAVIAVALSGAVWVSRSALPGDALYGLKRASESAQFSLTSGNVPRAKELLSFAKTRVDEVSDLIGRPSASGAGVQASGGISASTATLVKSTLGSADDDLTQAAQLLGAQAVRDTSSAPLAVMIDWAPTQMHRLADVVARTPAGPLRDRVMASAQLLSDAYTRAQALKALQGCSCLTTAPTDALGPVPCPVCVTPAPSAPTQQPTRPGSAAPTPGQPVPGVGPTGSTAPTGATDPATSGNTTPKSTPTGSPTPTGATEPGQPQPTPGLPPLQLPTLPLPLLSTPPLTIDSCGLGITLGPIGIGLGPCGVHIHI